MDYIPDVTFFLSFAIALLLYVQTLTFIIYYYIAEGANY